MANLRTIEIGSLSPKTHFYWLINATRKVYTTLSNVPGKNKMFRIAVRISWIYNEVSIYTLVFRGVCFKLLFVNIQHRTCSIWGRLLLCSNSLSTEAQHPHLFSSVSKEQFCFCIFKLELFVACIRPTRLEHRPSFNASRSLPIKACSRNSSILIRKCSACLSWNYFSNERVCFMPNDKTIGS